MSCGLSPLNHPHVTYHGQKHQGQNLVHLAACISYYSTYRVKQCIRTCF